ncbi:MAG TPA: hypothetical protein VH988_26615 [Thermoanaerobaculia bacterium]|jgi:hypothetical protein|nr:hypothetical protein [Thermoanaerobaculia bacterium]
MLSARCAVLTVAALLWAGISAASPAPVRLAVELTAPVAGEPLRAGSVAELAWEPREPLARNGLIQEWEAFLSLDGGAHYTVRVTPHLDRGLRKVLWQVPAIPTRDARLLLRFGDERREIVFAVPQRFVIAGPSRAAGFELLPARRSFSSGEPALPGQAGVVVWAEGTRQGGAARMVVGTEPPAVQLPRAQAGSAEETALLPAARGPELDPAAAIVPAGRVTPALPRHTLLALLRNDPAARIPILLQSRRRNE